jgi:predicted lipid-binding transport protein (Tim44 family)
LALSLLLLLLLLLLLRGAAHQAAPMFTRGRASRMAASIPRRAGTVASATPAPARGDAAAAPAATQALPGRGQLTAATHRAAVAAACNHGLVHAAA